jgi:hypothetical protein
MINTFIANYHSNCYIHWTHTISWKLSQVFSKQINK